MAIRDLRRLFEAIAGQDWANAISLARNIAKAEAKRGNHTAARTLEGAFKHYRHLVCHAHGHAEPWSDEDDLKHQIV